MSADSRSPRCAGANATLLAILLAVAGLHAVATAVLRPPFQVSDEMAYFATIQARAIEPLPAGSPERLVAAPPDGTPVQEVLNTKPAFQAAGSRLYRALLGVTTAPSAMLWLRLLCSLSAVASVLFTYLIARHLFPSSSLVVWGAPLVVATHPVFMTFSAGITPDAPTNALSALTLWFALRFASRTSSPLEPLAMLVSAAGAIAMKDTAFFLVAVVALAWTARGLAWWQAGPTRGRLDGWLLAGPIAVGAGIAAAPLAGWLRSPYWPRVALPTQSLPGVASSVVAELVGQMPGAFDTFWSLGEFGGNRPLLPHGVVVVAALTGALAAFGLVRYAVARPSWEPLASRRRHRGLLAVSLLGLVVLVLQPPLRNLVLGTDDVFQGRWLFPGLPLLAVLACAGLSSFLRQPARGLPVLSVLASMLPVIAFAGTIIPGYYDSFPSGYAVSRLHLLGSYGAALEPGPVNALIVRPDWASSWWVVWVPLCGLAVLLAAWNVQALRLSSRGSGVG